MEHHLRYDGDGYPSLPAVCKPNIASQMIAVSDAFDNLRIGRLRSKPMPVKKAADVLAEEKGTAFHPILVDHFFSRVNLKPK